MQRLANTGAAFAQPAIRGEGGGWERDIRGSRPAPSSKRGHYPVGSITPQDMLA